MDEITIVGSGASGVHFALSLLRKGYRVTMFDVGYKSPQPIYPNDSFNELKRKINDPVKYFLGEEYQALIFRNSDSEYYGFPPSKDYIFRSIPNNEVRNIGFKPLLSFAQGGLAEAWTGGCYPFTDDDLKDFSFSYEDIKPHYEEVSRRIGVTGVEDDLVDYFPYHNGLMNPTELDEHAQLILMKYEERKDYLNNKLGLYLGRSRTAVLSEDKNERRKCNSNGRCLWGCPTNALYTPSITLKECMSYSNFNYLMGNYVSHFKFNSGNRITSIVTHSLKKRDKIEYKVNKLILAAGTLSSSRIFLNSIYFNSGNIIRLKGLMDNRQIMAPFLNTKMIGRKFNPKAYQYHQLAIAMREENCQNNVHGLITTLKTALFHPIIQSVPFDSRTSVFLFRNVHAALGVVNINLSDTRRESNYLTIEHDNENAFPDLLIHYKPEKDEKVRIKRSMSRFKKALCKLGCFVISGMEHIRPMGASVHYSGTIPMSNKKGPYTTSEYCENNEFKNLFHVDGTSFPFLPAKNLTFTLMANAVRVAETVF